MFVVFVPESGLIAESVRLTFGRGPEGGMGKSRGAFRPFVGHTPAMASKAIRLDPQTVEVLALKVVEILEARGLQKRQLVSAAELAQMFGIERSWVYAHAIELGAVKLGEGKKPRLRFDPEVAARVLRRVGEVPVADPPTRSGERADRPGGRRERGELLPIRGDEPPPAA